MGAVAATLGDIDQPIKAIVGVNAAVYFLHAAPRLSDRYFDLTGSCAFATATCLGLAGAGRGSGHRREAEAPPEEAAAPSQEPAVRAHARPSVLRAQLASGALLLWCTRLGLFLLARITRDGKDRRQDSMKVSRLKFSIPWIIQSLWCSLVGLPTWLTNHYATEHALDAVDGGALGLYALGLALEAKADEQKRAFAAAGLRDSVGFISSGLWSRSRHPNYVGEIMLWIGLSVFGHNSIRRNQACAAPFLSFMSPLFTYLLLGYVTGVPPLEKRAMKKFGGRPEYLAYLAETPELFPRSLKVSLCAVLLAAAVYMRRGSSRCHDRRKEAGST